MTAYRNDIDALAAREETLARELADKQRERAEVQRMLEDARALEAATAHERDVMVGRRRLRWGAVAAGALLATGVAAGARHYASQSQVPACTRSCAAHEAPRDDVRHGLLLAAKGLTPVELEPRFVAGDGFTSLDELHAAVGEDVAAWQQFTFTRDAHARQAIASPVYRVGDPVPEPELVSDGFGGVWRVVPEVARPAREAVQSQRVTRMVWLLPTGSVFRGDVDVR